ncbi:MAG: hypothetical protein J6J37_05280 [Bacteroidaceae bacterium]|nr:hypothetical protein [Bacteroidaceae bacterium]
MNTTEKINLLRLFAFITAILCTMNVQSQDILVKRSGGELQVKVLKISSEVIEYKKWSNQDGPTYTLATSEVNMIKYENGEQDVFNSDTSAEVSEDSTTTAVEKNSKGHIRATPAANNQSLIDEYNNEIHTYIAKGEPKNKKARSAIGTLGVTAASILSTNEIEITLRQATEAESSRFLTNEQVGDRGEFSNMYVYWSYVIKFVIEITNKTSENIYIDKTSCSRTSADGKIKNFYNPNKLVIVNGGAANEIQDSPLLVIPPKGKVLLSKDDFIRIDKEKDVVTGVAEWVNLTLPNLHMNQYQQFGEEDNPNKWRYNISYSKTEDCKNCYYVDFGVYLKDVLGSKTTTGTYLKNLDDHFQSRTNKTIVVSDWSLEILWQ